MEPFRIRVERGNRIALPDRLCELMGWRTGSLIEVAVTLKGDVALRPKHNPGDKVVVLHPIRRTP